MFCYLTMSATTFTFLLVWEHSHYVLFIQGLALFLLHSFDLVPPRKVTQSQNRLFYQKTRLILRVVCEHQESYGRLPKSSVEEAFEEEAFMTFQNPVDFICEL